MPNPNLRYSICMIKGQPEDVIVRLLTFGGLGEKLL
jgi:hypothetical protein